MGRGGGYQKLTAMWRKGDNSGVSSGGQGAQLPPPTFFAKRPYDASKLMKMHNFGSIIVKFSHGGHAPQIPLKGHLPKNNMIMFSLFRDKSWSSVEK